MRNIEPMLEVGGIVICDRYKFTAMARDGARDVPLDFIEATYSFAREPDLTLYFDVPGDVSYDRIVSGRPSLKFYEAGLDMGWTHDPFESYRMPQERMRESTTAWSRTGASSVSMPWAPSPRSRRESVRSSPRTSTSRRSNRSMSTIDWPG